jgi:3-hydroxybutyryl-CoA dehydratase
MLNKGEVIHQKYSVDEKVYLGFISLFQDNNPLHTNESFAIEKGFKGKVMHGNILNGFISHFVGECLPTKEVIIHSQEINYLKPVFLNDILHLFVEVNNYWESVQTIDLKFYFRNQEKVKVARGKLTIGLI